MDNAHLKKYIVRYHRDNQNGSYTEFHDRDFDNLDSAQEYVKKRNSTAYPNEKYFIIFN